MMKILKTLCVLLLSFTLIGCDEKENDKQDTTSVSTKDNKEVEKKDIDNKEPKVEDYNFELNDDESQIINEKINAINEKLVDKNVELVEKYRYQQPGLSTMYHIQYKGTEETKNSISITLNENYELKTLFCSSGELNQEAGAIDSFFIFLDIAKVLADVDTTAMLNDYTSAMQNPQNILKKTYGNYELNCLIVTGTFNLGMK